MKQENFEKANSIKNEIEQIEYLLKTVDSEKGFKYNKKPKYDHTQWGETRYYKIPNVLNHSIIQAAKNKLDQLRKEFDEL